ncbi:hypothetical protein ACHQM5_021188 [Ranunculus cassubicifolius]
MTSLVDEINDKTQSDSSESMDRESSDVVEKYNNSSIHVNKDRLIDSSCDPHHREIDWLALPRELLSIVADKVDKCKDYTRFGAVCKSWQEISIENKDHLLREPLLLMFPTEGETRSLYSLSEKRFYNSFKVKVPLDRVCRGSSYGWLALISNDLDISLVNPLLSHDNDIWLPRIEGLAEVIDLKKVVLSANPMSNPNYVAVAIHGGQYSISFFKPGDRTWTPLTSTLYPIWPICDILYYEDKVYALHHHGEIFACDVNGPSCIVTPVAPKRNSEIFGDNYFVRSSTGWLQIVRHMDFKKDSDYYFASGFTVLKLDDDADEWRKVNSIDGRILFLGDNYSLCLSVSDMPGCKPNCIYYTDDKHEYYFYMVEFGPHDMGVFNLKDDSKEPLYPMDSNMIIPAPIFFQPAPSKAGPTNLGALDES